MAVDWSTFWPDLLIGLISGTFILVLGGVVAYFTINKFQKQNEIARVKNDLIDVVEDSYSLLSQILLSYDIWFNNQNDINASYRCNLILSEIMSKNKILLAKVVNQIEVITEEKKHELYLKLITIRAHRQINKTTVLIIENLSKGVEQGIKEQIVESIKESYQKISKLLVVIISSFKNLSSEIEEIEDLVKELIEEEKKL